MRLWLPSDSVTSHPSGGCRPHLYRNWYSHKLPFKVNKYSSLCKNRYQGICLCLWWNHRNNELVGSINWLSGIWSKVWSSYLSSSPLYNSLREVCKKNNRLFIHLWWIRGGGARRWIKKATNVITLTWPMVDKIFFWKNNAKKGLNYAKKGLK